MPITRPEDPITGPGTTPDQFQARVARVAAERSRAWTAFADIIAGPDERNVALLRSGELTAAWRAGVTWIGADVEMFLGPLLSLDVYARGAHRRVLASDVAALALDHGVLVAPHAAELTPLLEVARLCDLEAAAWTSGDVSLGRDLRARQHALVAAELVPVLPDLGHQLSTAAQAEIWRALGRLLVAFISIETGQDYQRAVLGAARARYLGTDADGAHGHAHGSDA